MIYKTEQQNISPYLSDASNYSEGFAEKVVIPESSYDLIKFLKTNNKPITIAGARTGMTGSCIPKSGIIISLEQFNHLGNLEKGYIDVEPAVTLAQLNECLSLTPFFYPPNPTEMLASIGGTMATNASGSRSYKYGVTRDYIVEADIILSNGELISLKRGQTIQNPLRLSDGRDLCFPNVNYISPSCKNSAGYYIKPNMDWLDLFIGSEGTLGIFSRTRLKLISRPEAFISGVLFFLKVDDCWELAHSIKSMESNLINPCSLEYFDSRSLDRLRTKFDNIPPNAKAALFFENDINKLSDYDASLEAWFDYLNNKSLHMDDSWFAQSPQDEKRFQDFRHTIPALINEENSRLGRVKIGTDLAVSDNYFIPMLKYYRDQLEASNIDFVIFGHLGDNHLHINLLPDFSQIKKANDLHRIITNQILDWNGTVSAEHGIGKLKKEAYKMMVGLSSIEELKSIKKIFDPQWILGKGNIF